MDCIAADCAVACCREAYRQAGARCRAHRKVRITEGLTGQRRKRYRLARFLRRHRFGYLSCGVVVAITRLVIVHATVACAAGHGKDSTAVCADAATAIRDWQTGVRASGYCEARII